MASPAPSPLVQSQYGAFFHLWSQNEWTSFNEHSVAQFTVTRPDNSSYLGKLVVSRSNGTPMTSCSFSFPIDNASWKFLQKATKIIVINEAEGKTSKILLDMDTKSEANNLLALLQQYSTKARQEASLRKEEANAAPLTSKMADVSTSVDETVANYDDPSTSFLETSTTSYTDFILSSNDNDHAILNGASSTLPNPFHDMEADNFEAANFVSSGTEAQPFHPLRTTAASTDFDTPANSGLDPRFTDLEPLVDFQRPKSSGTHPSLLPFYETLQDVYGRWDTLTDAEKAAWMPED